MQPALIRQHFDNAELFLAAIRRSNERWWPHDSARSPWAFRGIGDANEWQLIPSAWRNDANNNLHHLISQFNAADTPIPQSAQGSNVIRNGYFWEFAEREALFQFADLANAAGFSVPPGSFDSSESPMQSEKLRLTEGGVFSSFQLGTTRERVAAIAQHHGIPTRLLDWTESPLVAAFFASSSIHRPKKEGQPSDICVWALDTEGIQGPGFFDGMYLIVHRPARGDNNYLHSQGGLFTELRLALNWFIEHEGKWPSLEEALKDKKSEKSVLVGHVLCGQQVPRLERLLEREGIHSAALMPTMDNVARTVQSRWIGQAAENAQRKAFQASELAS